MTNLPLWPNTMKMTKLGRRVRYSLSHRPVHLWLHLHATSMMMPRAPPASFEAKLGNPCPTCFMMKQAAGSRRVSSHCLRPLIGFEAQTEKPPPTWF
jgi:hypothetical protein